MKFGCHCGQVLRDQTDFIPYKGYFLADQDQESMLDELDEHGRQLVAACDGQPAEKTEEALENYTQEVSWTVSRYMSRVMFQCLTCGRIYLENRDRDARLRSFSPDDHEWDRLLCSVRGEDAFPWKTDLVGNWDEEHEEGALWWYPPPDQHGGLETLQTQEELEARYHELLESLKDSGHLRSARLGIQEKSGAIKDIHNWRDGQKS